MIEDSRKKARILLGKAVDFHGHLGPFLALGIRMSMVAQSVLKVENQDDLSVVMFVEPHPPASCTVDGVQVASGCTLGKGTIRVSEASDRIAGMFRAGVRACTINVRIQVLSELLEALRKATDQAIFDMAEDVMARPDRDLFEISLDS
jgi:formylmethanofuran dehydrogenase subunit E